jgi:hypothetical protein
VARVSFPFYQDLPVVEIKLARRRAAGQLTRRLAVDTGFTGQSGLVLPPRDRSLVAHRWAGSSLTQGAIPGQQTRFWVTCSVVPLSFQRQLIAICTDLAPLALPQGLDGLVGLTFLACFDAWGAEQSPASEWQFFLETRRPSAFTAAS